MISRGQSSDNEQAPEPAIRLGLELLYSAPCDAGQLGPLVEYASPNCCSFHAGYQLLNHALFSVVAVHGLGAHPDYTWTAGDVNWLRNEHMLPRAIPNSRILRFGYESQWVGKEAIQQRLPLVADQLLRNMMALRKVWCNALLPEIVRLRILIGLSVATNRIYWALFWWYSH